MHERLQLSVSLYLSSIPAYRVLAREKSGGHCTLAKSVIQAKYADLWGRVKCPVPRPGIVRAQKAGASWLIEATDIKHCAQTLCEYLAVVFRAAYLAIYKRLASKRS